MHLQRGQASYRRVGVYIAGRWYGRSSWEVDFLGTHHFMTQLACSPPWHGILDCSRGVHARDLQTLLNRTTRPLGLYIFVWAKA